MGLVGAFMNWWSHMGVGNGPIQIVGLYQSYPPDNSKFPNITQGLTLHVSYLRSELIKCLKMLDKLKHILNRQTKLMLYKNLLGPLFDYWDVIYDGIGQRESQPLQKLQNSALRRILNCNSRIPVAEMHARLNLDTLEVRRYKHINTQTYRCLYNLAPPKVSALINIHVPRHWMITRSIDDHELEVPKITLEMCK